MVDEGTKYMCDRCRKVVWYSLVEATQVMRKYGKIICRWCLGKDKNGEIRRKSN